MSTLLILMIVAAIAAIFWSTSRSATERAIALGQQACAEAGVQLIDHTVHGAGLRLRRHANGWLGLERTFRFEYSRNGADRHVAKMVLHGRRLLSFSGPLSGADSISTDSIVANVVAPSLGADRSGASNPRLDLD